MSQARRVLVFGLAVSVGVVAVACAKVPYTNRRQFNLVPDGIMTGLGKSTYTTMLQGKSLQTAGQNHEVLTRVGGRISRVADKPSFDWQFRMIEEPEVNAWCLPGGYIGFYTGILPVLRNEAGMSFVMGHEVGHATAKHGAERMSQNLALVGGLGVLELYLSGKEKLSDEQRGLVLGALGVGAQVGVLLPFSRAHESEADVIGLMYMAGAGYPPAESIEVWDRMAQLTGKGAVPTFLSTHPSHDKRQDNLREWMPQAMKRYERNRLGGDMLEAIWTGPVPAPRAPVKTKDAPAPPKTSDDGGTTSGGTTSGGTTSGGNRGGTGK